MHDLLSVSIAPGQDKTLRALEVTVIDYNEVVSGVILPGVNLQYGELLKNHQS